MDKISNSTLVSKARKNREYLKNKSKSINRPNNSHLEEKKSQNQKNFRSFAHDQREEDSHKLPVLVDRQEFDQLKENQKVILEKLDLIQLKYLKKLDHPS